MIEYIEKRDVIDELMDYASRWFAYDPYNKMVARIFQDIEFIIKGIPSTDAIEPKRGEWIDRSGGIEGVWNYCSVCGEQAIDLYDFCPNCGADMRKESE